MRNFKTFSMREMRTFEFFLRLVEERGRCCQLSLYIEFTELVIRRKILAWWCHVLGKCMVEIWSNDSKIRLEYA